LKAGRTSAAKTEDEYLQALRKQFDEKRARRYWLFFYWLREDHGRGGFLDYLDEAKRRLARHGFTPIFRLDEDATRQDKLTTWIEYFNYECSWYDNYTRSVERLKPHHDEAWQKLVNSGVLRAGETTEYLLTNESAHRCQTEIDQGRMAVKSAMNLGEAALGETAKARIDSRLSRFTKEERIRRLAAANSRVLATKASLKSIRRRLDLISEFIRGTHFYREQQRNLLSHGLLLQWIRDQVFVIEAEMGESNMALGSSHTGRDGRPQGVEEGKPTKQRRHGQSNSFPDDAHSLAPAKQPPKRGRHNDTIDDARPSKRVRNDARDAVPYRATSVRESQEPEATTVAGSQAVPQQLRRSARIAARQLPARPVSPPERIQNTKRPRSSRKRPQAPTPRLSEKMPKGRAATRGGPLGTSKPNGISKRRRPR
jgi:hypothetical protein